MPVVRCISCQRVFPTEASAPDAKVRCPGCGDVHQLSALTSSTAAGDSMMINPVALKQILKSPTGPGPGAPHERTEPIILCPSCKVRLYVDLKKYAGKKVLCPKCKKPMRIPRPVPSSSKPAAPKPEAPSPGAPGIK